MKYEKQIREIANRTGISEKAVQRLAGSARVTATGVPPGIEPKSMELGLRLIVADGNVRVPPSEFESCLEIVMREYASCCPQVVQWLGRGDFNPESPPRELVRANMVHAARTAGRLRAKALRILSAYISEC